ncbi:MAG: hypothetical protein AAGC55_00285 [Myxococcota bacterium]
MTPVKVGFFVVPKDSVDELTLLSRDWRGALWAMEEDVEVRSNQLFRYAARVALHHGEQSGMDCYSAFAEVSAFVIQTFWNGKDQDVFAPDECHQLLASIFDHEGRKSGADDVMARLAKYAPEALPDMLCTIYQQIKETLSKADAGGAGCVFAVYHDGAEAELAAKKAALEHLQRTTEPLSAEANARFAQAVAAFDARQDRAWARHSEEEAAGMTGLSQVWLHLIPDDTATELRVRVAEIYARYAADEGERGLELLLALTRQLEQFELPVVRLRHYGEYLYFERLELLLSESRLSGRSQLDDNRGVYATDDVRTELAALDHAESERGGAAGVIDWMIGDSHTPRSYAERTLREYRTALATAAERGCGMVRLIADHDVLVCSGYLGREPR